MLTAITINNVATYCLPTQMNDFKKINFIFGSNGSGKTTISRVLDQTEGYRHCTLQWENRIPLKVLVYNSDFIENNFNQENTVKGVFTLGSDQVDAEIQINRLIPQIDTLNQEIGRLNAQLNGDGAGQIGKIAELEALEPELQEKCWRQKQLHDSYFQEAFTGLRNNAERFKEKILQQKQINNSELLSLDELKEKSSTVFSNDLQRYNPLPIFDPTYLLQAQSNNILQKIIIGNQEAPIAQLIESLGNSDWVKQGINHLKNSSPTCPFCQQTISHNLVEDFNNFFSEIYDQDIRTVKILNQEYIAAANNIQNIIDNIIDQNNPFLDLSLFEADCQALKSQIEVNKGILQRKLLEPSLVLSFEPIDITVNKILELIQNTNSRISEHNQIVQNINSEKENLKNQIWKYVINELDSDLQQYIDRKNRLNATINGMTQSLNTKKQRLRELEQEIREQEQRSTSTAPTINEINTLLQSFGFTSFSIQPVDQQGHYKICRVNGDDASRSLSEGEKTFITFLYFYCLIKGSHSTSGITENRVVVFDDPISSLDSDILYIVSSLIKKIFENIRQSNCLIKQIFVLTHNVYFHKELSFHKNRSKTQIMNDESFWMVRKTASSSTVEKCVENPIRSAYELLWSDIRIQNTSSLTIQNTLRRILENYFTMWGGKSKDEVCDLFEGTDKLICQSLFSWVNDGSHSIHDDLYINHGEQTNESYLRVFKEIFNKSGHYAHYEMMVPS